MADHIELGKLGEQLEIDCLLSKGYLILEKNWRWGHIEIDIVTKEEEKLVFIEVKSRSTDYGKPEEAVDDNKQELMAEGAAQYAYENDHQWEVRFDVISLLIKNSEVYTIDHFKDAFFPGW